MRKVRLFLVLVLAVAALYLGNGSWRAAPPQDPRILLIAHRGVHQTFHREGLNNDTCTAKRVHQPSHPFLENTIPAMRAAFAAGADVVELDVHPTADGHFAVLHDWTLDCRTEGSGVTRSHNLAYLKSLDVGYGYTADGGTTFPFRGRGIGLLPELTEIFSALPEGRFLVNFKSHEEREGDMLAALLAAHPEWRSRIWGVYGGEEPTFRAAALLNSDLKAWSRQSLIGCLGRYVAFGWSGLVPDACRNTAIMIPVNAGPWLWGWPNLLLQRFRKAGSDIILLGPYSSGDPGTAGIDSLELLAEIPPGFSGYIWTNKIDFIGPALKAMTDSPRP